jgi:large subunit ribosomal protein L15
MRLDQLPKTTIKKKKRVGRGYGSGKGGHTTGRGHKGQKARSKVPLGFEGGQTTLSRRLPLKRGKDNISTRPKPLVVNVRYLNLLPEKSRVTLEALIEAGIVAGNEARQSGVKILGGGELNRSLIIALPCSKSAKAKIEAAGGKVEVGE